MSSNLTIRTGDVEEIPSDVISSPSDELKGSKQPPPQPLQQIQEGYHSVPESGDAMNVGYASAGKGSDNNNNNNGSIDNKRPVGSYVTMDQEQQKSDTFEDDYGSYISSNISGLSGDLSLKLKQMASDVSWNFNLGSWTWPSRIGETWTNLTSGGNPFVLQKTFVQACYLGIAAIFGTLVRLILAQLFGQACANPETIGWIADEAVLCVTSDGTTTQNEGIIFADLPANLLGSFIMGLLQDGAALGLAVNLPIAFLKPSNPFQSFDVFHLALKTGFCGSLTTFSAWNSEMVVLMVGHLVALPNRQSMIWRALFGYIIGMETAIGSYVFGRTVAWWLHRWINPELAKEQKEMQIRETRHGIAINRELPLVERRYLHGLSDASIPSTETDTDDESAESALPHISTLTEVELAPLRQWRESTKEARRVESGVSATLVELETALIARKEVVLTQELRETAVHYGWDIDSLQQWLSKRQGFGVPPAISQVASLTAAGVSETVNEEDTVWYTAPAAGLLLALCLMILVNIMINLNAKTAYAITYRTMAYSMLFATPGALLRWKLSTLNGKLADYIPRFHRMSWLPLGTLSANVLGAIVSICMIGWEYNLETGGAGGYWAIATARAIKIGFSGCLSTVSTFVSEVHKLTKVRTDRGYKYILITLVMSCVLGIIFFVAIV